MRLPINRHGFTLIEIIISVSIISLLTAGIIPSFSTYIRSQNLKQAQEQLKSDLRSVQIKALSGTYSDQLINGQPVNFWGVRFVRDSGVYTFFISSVNNTCPSSFVSGQNKGSGKFNKDITIRTSNTSGSCMFFSLENGDISTSGSGMGSPIIIGYGSTAAANSRRVYFNSMGLIYTQDD